MEREKIQVANLKCNGCATTIKKELLAIQGVDTIDVDVANDSIDITYHNVNRDVIINRLHALGYPEATKKMGFCCSLKVTPVACLGGCIAWSNLFLSSVALAYQKGFTMFYLAQ